MSKKLTISEMKAMGLDADSLQLQSKRHGKRHGWSVPAIPDTTYPGRGGGGHDVLRYDVEYVKKMLAARKAGYRSDASFHKKGETWTPAPLLEQGKPPEIKPRFKRSSLRWFH